MSGRDAWLLWHNTVRDPQLRKGLSADPGYWTAVSDYYLIGQTVAEVRAAWAAWIGGPVDPASGHDEEVVTDLRTPHSLRFGTEIAIPSGGSPLFLSTAAYPGAWEE